MDEENVIYALYEIGCVKIGNFKLTSGMISPIYIDLRTLPSHPRIFRIIVRESINRVISRIDFNVVCGIATGGIPLATAIAYEMRKPMIYVRKKAKGHGMQKLVEGDYKEGVVVLLVDDVATTGGTLTRTIDILRDEGLIVKDAFVIVDRGQGAKEKLSEKGVELHYLMTLNEIVEYLNKRSLISREDYLRIIEYLGEANV
mgnify:CR=1 FL=1